MTIIAVGPKWEINVMEIVKHVNLLLALSIMAGTIKPIFALDEIDWRGSETSVTARIRGAHVNRNNSIGLEVYLHGHGDAPLYLTEEDSLSGFKVMAWSLSGEAYAIEVREETPFSMKLVVLAPRGTILYSNIEMPIPEDLKYPFIVQVSKNIGDKFPRVLSSPAVIYKKADDGDKLSVLSLPERVADLEAQGGMIPHARPETPAPPPEADKPMGRDEVFAAVRKLGELNLRYIAMSLGMHARSGKTFEGLRYPSSIDELREYNVSDRDYQSPTRKTVEEWRCDYTLAPAKLFKGDGKVPKDMRVVLWDNPGNWPDGGMAVFFNGFIQFVQAEPDVWRRLTEAFAAGKNKKLILKYIPEANVDGFSEEE